MARFINKRVTPMVKRNFLTPLRSQIVNQVEEIHVQEEDVKEKEEIIEIQAMVEEINETVVLEEEEQTQNNVSKKKKNKKYDNTRENTTSE